MNNNTRNINSNFFNNIGHRQAYILGYLFADGCIRFTQRHKYAVSFATIDEELFNKIKNALGVKNLGFVRFNKFNGKRIFCFTTSNEQITDDLLKLGMIPNKAKRLVYPSHLNNNLFCDFLRGFFDGDGCAHIAYNASGKMQTLIVFISSMSYNFLSTLKFLLKQHFIDSTITKNTIFNLIIRRYLDIKKLYKLMYHGNTDNLFLSRKKNRFVKFLDEYIPSVVNGHCTDEFKQRLSLINTKVHNTPSMIKKHRKNSIVAYQNPLLRKKLSRAIKNSLKKPGNYRKLLIRAKKIGKLKTKKRFDFLNSKIHEIESIYRKTHSLERTSKIFKCSGNTIAKVLDDNSINREMHNSHYMKG